MKCFITVFSVFFCIGITFFSQISPAHALLLKTLRIETKVNPGDQLAEIIEVKNDQEKRITLYPSIEGFTDAGDESGHPNFIPIDSDIDDLPNWIRFNHEFYTLAPGESALIPFVINIPQQASPGGHYASIFFTNDPPQDGNSQVKIGVKVGTLVILDIAGEVKEGGIFESFEKDRFFYNHLPITFVSRIYNEGNVHFKPQGKIKIKNMLGLTSQEITFNFVQGNVLPLSTRRFEDVWVKNEEIGEDENFWGKVKKEWSNFGLGLYTAHAQVDIGRNSPYIIEAKTRFFVFPWRIASLTLLGGLVIAYIFKLYDASVIRRAQKSLNEKKKK